MLPTPEGANADEAAYTLKGVLDTFRVNANNTTTDLVQITAVSVKYGVEYTWDLSKATFDGEGAKNAAELMTQQVNQLMSAAHVIGARPSQDQDVSGVLYNYLVVIVGVPDGSIQTEVSIRMDHIGLPSAFGAVDDAWKQLVALGAS